MTYPVSDTQKTMPKHKIRSYLCRVLSFHVISPIKDDGGSHYMHYIYELLDIERLF